MKTFKKPSFIHTAVVGATVFALAPLHCQASVIYGVTQYSELVSFDSAAPGTILSSVGISGLSAQFESVAGIDFRPATGQLYAMGNAPGSEYRLYTLNLSNGVATQVGTSFVSFNTTAIGFGFDFNPVTDRIRVVNDAKENGRFNPNDGTYSADTPLTSSSDFPFYQDSLVAAAFTNNFAGATTTQLFGIDYRASALFEQTSPSGGTLELVGGLNTPLDDNAVGFDISAATGIAYLTSSSYDSGYIPGTTLYTVNLASGQATSLGAVGDQLYLRGVAVAPVPELGSVTMFSLGIGMLGLRRRRK